MRTRKRRARINQVSSIQTRLHQTTTINNGSTKWGKKTVDRLLRKRTEKKLTFRWLKSPWKKIWSARKVCLTFRQFAIVKISTLKLGLVLTTRRNSRAAFKNILRNQTTLSELRVSKKAKVINSVPKQWSNCWISPCRLVNWLQRGIMIRTAINLWTPRPKRRPSSSDNWKPMRGKDKTQPRSSWLHRNLINKRSWRKPIFRDKQKCKR